jgi:hypothetical protein
VLTFITVSSPAQFILSEGTFSEITPGGTVHGTASGIGAISTDGTLTTILDLAFTLGNGPLIAEEVKFTGLAAPTSPQTVAISGSYLGSPSAVPEPGSVVLFATVALAILGYRRVRRSVSASVFSQGK